MPGLEAYRDTILPLRERAQVQDEWLRHRLDVILPELMVREGLDMWIVVAREYNEDPVIMTLLPASSLSARRRTILVFTLHDGGHVERLTLGRYDIADLYERVWDGESETQFECLARVVAESAPQAIGINVSPKSAFGDGLSHSEYEAVIAALGDTYAGRTQSADGLCVGWLERRSHHELAAYPALVAMGHALIRDAYSTRVIQPGTTTTDDVAWWLRQAIRDLGLLAWFQPTVDIQAPGHANGGAGHGRARIMPGDLLHCDVGLKYLGLCTDQQQNAYVLGPGDTHPPTGLEHALDLANRLQEIHAAQMVVGTTGNDVLARVRAEALAEDLVPSVYTHPLGYHGHGAGPTIGLWDQQEGVPVRGDYVLHDDTCYAIELNVSASVPEWGGHKVKMALEEDAVLSNGQLSWLSGRQTALHVIG